MPSKKYTKVVPACLDPHLPESLGLFSSRPPVGSRRGRRRGGRQRGESHIRGRSCWHRASGGAASSSPPHIGRRAPVRLHLRGKSARRRDSHAGRWGRSFHGKTAPRSSPPSARPRHERRSGCSSGTPRGTPGSFSTASAQASARVASHPEARCLAERCGAPQTANHWSPFAGAAGVWQARRARLPTSARERETRPSPNCAGSAKTWATKKPGRPCHPGFFP